MPSASWYSRKSARAISTKAALSASVISIIAGCRAGSSDQLGHTLRRRPPSLALALELPERSLPIEAVHLTEHLQPPLPKPQGQSHALLERKAKHLLLKLVSQVIGYGSHGVSISRGNHRPQDGCSGARALRMAPAPELADVRVASCSGQSLFASHILEAYRPSVCKPRSVITTTDLG